MARKNSFPYRRLPGGRLTRNSLWLTDDHVLSLERREFTERYARFYFRDIQAIVLQRTATYVVLNVIFLLLTGLFSLLALTSGDDFLAFWWALTGLAGLVAAWNLWLGPTCVCYVLTAIDRYRVKALSRTRIARRVLDRLQPLIEEAQQDIDVEAARTSAVTPESDMFPRQAQEQPRPTHARPVEPPPVKHYHGAIHIAVFVLLLLNGLALAGLLLMFGVVSVVGYGLTMTALGVCMIIALVQQAGTDMPRAIQGLVWAQFGYIVLSLMTAGAFFMVAFYTFVRDVGNSMLQSDMSAADVMAHFAPADFPVFLGIYAVFLAATLIVGTLGLILLHQFRQATKP